MLKIDKQLLLIVQATCEEKHIEEFNRWYNNHLPNLLRIPGYLWAQRYRGMEEPNQFLALYGIRAKKDLPNLLEWNGPNLHEIAKKEFAGWNQLHGLSNIILNVYEQIMGDPLRQPFLCSDGPINLTSTEPNPDHELSWNEWYSGSHVPNLLKIPGYIMAGRFRLLENAVTTKINTGPKYVAIYECSSNEVVASLRIGPQMRQEAIEEFKIFERDWATHTRTVSRGFYRMISKHFKWATN